MGSNSSKASSQATTLAPAASLIPITVTSIISAPARPVPAVVSTVSLITTIIQSESGSISTIRATETVIESIIISVTPTPIPTPTPAAVPTPAIEVSSTLSLIPLISSKSSSSRPLSRTASGASVSPQRAAATAASSKPSAAAAQQTLQPELVQQNVKKPIAPPDAILGGIPNKNIDLPITIVFLVFFITGAVTHFSIHEVNSKRGHKFHLSDLVFDFCMVRTVTCTMRIVWIFRPNNNSIVLAALIFEGAGVVVLFAVNTFFTQRLIRSIHPKVGWSGPGTLIFWGIIASVPTIIFYNIINATLSVFLIKPQQAATIHDLVIFGSSYTLFLGSIPLTFLSVAALFPSSTPPERFGKGGLHAKLLILILASAALTVGAVIRLVTTVKTRPKDDPGALNSKAVFYITGFMLEIMVVAGYALSRIDLRFHVPDGCTGPGDYSKSKVAETAEDDREKLIEGEDVEVKMRISVDSYEYRGNAPLPPPPPGGGVGQTAPVTRNPGSTMPGTMPRRPPRSMAWENQARAGIVDDVRSVI